MKKSIVCILAIGLFFIGLATGGFTETINLVNQEELRNNSATLFDGKVRINTLVFHNQLVKEPLLLYQGSYYLPMTPDVIKNLGFKSGMSEEGILSFELSTPTVDGFKSSLKETTENKERVSVIVYNKPMVFGSVTVDPESAFHPVIVYNNTFYVPLNATIRDEGLMLSIYFSEDGTLTIHRNIGKMPRGTVLEFPDTSNRAYLATMEEELWQLKDQLINQGERVDLKDQTQYIGDVENPINYYVAFSNGDWQVVDGEKNQTMYYYNKDGFRYVGQHVEGQFNGLGRLIASDGNITAIKPFDHSFNEIPYSQQEITYPPYLPTLAVLIDFKDETIIGTNQQWYDKLYTDDPNSLSGYYKEITANQLNITPALEKNDRINDGIVRVSLDRLHPNSKNEIGGANDILTEAFSALEDQVNFSLYDRNGNGVIDRDELAIIAILAGYESSKYAPADYPQFRSHHLFSDVSLNIVDGIGLLNSIYISELDYFSNQTALSANSVFAHEFGHQLGLPDLYDTDGSSKGLGPFSLMAEGINNHSRGERPGQVIAYMDPWSCIKLKGITPQVVTASGQYDLRSVETEDYNVIRINTDNPNEYFLLENRRINGRDASLKTSVSQSGGVLIYHIDEDVIDAHYYTNTVNADENKKGVDIEEASERSSGSKLDNDNYQERYAPFFTASGNSSFNGVTRPLSRLNDGTPSGIGIEVLSDGPIATIEITIE